MKKNNLEDDISLLRNGEIRKHQKLNNGNIHWYVYVGQTMRIGQNPDSAFVMLSDAKKCAEKLSMDNGYACIYDDEACFRYFVYKQGALLHDYWSE